MNDRIIDKIPSPTRSHKRAHRGLLHAALLMSCFIMFLVVCKLYLNQYIEIRKLEEARRQSEARLKKRTAALEELHREVAFLGTMRGVEKTAREKLKYIKRDEVIIVPVQR